MGLVLVSAPNVEPLSTTDVKTHLRIDTADDDTLIGTYITVARKYCERYQNRALITQSWKLTIDDWPDLGEMGIPLAPLQSVTSIIYYDTADAPTTVSTTVYDVDTDSEPGRITLKYSKSWPTTTLRPYNGIEITYVCGYGDAATDIPENVIYAMKLLIGHMYENREATNIRALHDIPYSIKSMLDLERIVPV